MEGSSAATSASSPFIAHLYFWCLHPPFMDFVIPLGLGQLQSGLRAAPDGDFQA